MHLDIHVFSFVDLDKLYMCYNFIIIITFVSENLSLSLQIADFYRVFRETSSDAPVMLVGIKGTLMYMYMYAYTSKTYQATVRQRVY